MKLKYIFATITNSQSIDMRLIRNEHDSDNGIVNFSAIIQLATEITQSTWINLIVH